MLAMRVIVTLGQTVASLAQYFSLVQRVALSHTGIDTILLQLDLATDLIARTGFPAILTRNLSQRASRTAVAWPRENNSFCLENVRTPARRVPIEAVRR